MVLKSGRCRLQQFLDVPHAIRDARLHRWSATKINNAVLGHYQTSRLIELRANMVSSCLVRDFPLSLQICSIVRFSSP
jgi:hypothetical protein